MNKSLIHVLLGLALILPTNHAFSQSGWTWQNRSSDGSTLFAVALHHDTGFVVGAGGYHSSHNR